MARRDHDDDFDDPPPRKQSGSAVAIFAVVVVLLVLLGLGAVLLVGARNGRQAALEQAEAEREEAAINAEFDFTRLIYTREMFRALTMGRTTDELTEMLGRPTATQDNPDNTPRTWSYAERVMNPETNRPGPAILEFKDGRVASVRWQSE
ncbi:MAG TPA: hypothetical protein VKE40_20090 [Gemmataceae bacterium]|nr:hypothetical protein [Gemmataceae bacterium]